MQRADAIATMRTEIGYIHCNIQYGAPSMSFCKHEHEHAHANEMSVHDAMTTLGIPFEINLKTGEPPRILVQGTNLVDLLAIVHGDNWIKDAPVVKMIKTLPNAIIPSRAHGSDVGYDLTLVEIKKIIVPDRINQAGSIIMFDSGIQARIPWGTYLEIVPRSSLSKTGWMMANSVGIIDPSYRGNLMVACIKVDPDAEPLTLPFRGFQIIVRKHEHMIIEEATADDAITSRGDGGFGSTGSA